MKILLKFEIVLLFLIILIILGIVYKIQWLMGLSIIATTLISSVYVGIIGLVKEVSQEYKKELTTTHKIGNKITLDNDDYNFIRVEKNIKKLKTRF